ncbi:MAG: thioredoxin family protein [Saprospiraceae bacterium]
MRNLILAVTLLLVTISTHAQIHWEGGTYEAALQKAKQENKIIFIDVYADWCAPCKRMDYNVYNKRSVGNYYNRNFINIKVDSDNRLGKILDRKFNIQYLPGYLFINGDEEVIYKSSSYKAVDSFISLGKRAQNRFLNF